MGDVLKTSEMHSTSVKRFYQGIALLFNNHQSQDALDYFNPLHDDASLKLGALLASIYVYKHFKISSSETLAQLETTLKNERKKTEELPLYYAAVFLHLIDHQSKAREYIDRMLQIYPNNGDGLIIKGWIEIALGQKSKSKNTLDYFNANTSTEKNAVEATFGKIQYLLQTESVLEAIQVANRATMKYSKNPELAIVKMRSYLAAKDWDTVGEMAKSLTLSNSLTIKVLEMQILVTICRDGSFIDAIPLLKKLFHLMDNFESKNAQLYIQSAKLYARVCGRHLPILNELIPFVERAVSLEEKNPSFLSEMAYLQLIQGHHKDALATSKTASKLGETSIDVMLQTIHCLLEEEQYDAAQQQIAMCEELHESSSTVAVMHFIKAVMLRREGAKRSQAVEHLKQAYTIQMKGVEGVSFYGVDYLIELNPDFLLSIAEEYTYHDPEHSLAVLKDVLKVLTSVVDACPGLLPALYRLANIQFVMADYEAAIGTLRKIIDHVDPTFAEAYLLLARVELKQEKYSHAAQSLEMGLSYNFKVRDHPLYHLLLARIQRQKNDMDAALASLRMAMVASGMRPSASNASLMKQVKGNFSQPEKATTYIELFQVLMAMGKKVEAGQVIEEALQELRNSSQEGLVLLAQVDYLLDKDDIESALNRLRSLPASHPQYLKAHQKIADIYLDRLHDERNYLKCYEEIARQEPNAIHLTMLGDAHLVLHQADLAVSAYEQALKLEPRNYGVASKIGAALVLTHQYTKALNYFKDALRDPANVRLNTEYSDLLIRLGQLDKAEQIINGCLTPLKSPLPKDIEQLEQQVDLLLLLVKIQEKRSVSSIGTLRWAHDTCEFLLKQVPPEDRREFPSVQKKKTAAIAMQIAAHALTDRDTDTAVRFYKEALNSFAGIDSTENVQCMGQLAKIYLELGDTEACQFMWYVRK